jgi:hypothetical protein
VPCGGSGIERTNSDAAERRSLFEVTTIETDAVGLLVIHAQRIGSRYLELLKGGLQ